MNGAQRAAFYRMLAIGDLMSNVCYNLAQHTPDEVLGWDAAQANMRDLQTQWDAARNRYFALEVEALAAKSSARKSRGDVRQKAGANQPKNSNV